MTRKILTNTYANGLNYIQQRQETEKQLLERIKKDVNFRLYLKKLVLPMINSLNESIEATKTEGYASQEILDEVIEDRTADLNTWKKVMRAVL